MSLCVLPSNPKSPFQKTMVPVAIGFLRTNDHAAGHPYNSSTLRLPGDCVRQSAARRLLATESGSPRAVSQLSPETGPTALPTKRGGRFGDEWRALKPISYADTPDRHETDAELDRRRTSLQCPKWCRRGWDQNSAKELFD